MCYIDVMKQLYTLRAISIALLAVCALLGLGWVPIALVVFAFGAFTQQSILLSIAEVSMWAIPLTMLVWLFRSKKHMPSIGSVIILDAAYLMIVIYHAAIGWFSSPDVPITPWLIAYHCLAVIALAISTFFLSTRISRTH